MCVFCTSHTFNPFLLSLNTYKTLHNQLFFAVLTRSDRRPKEGEEEEEEEEEGSGGACVLFSTAAAALKKKER